MTSATLSGRFAESGVAFLQDMKETNALISGIFRMLHPDQCRHGLAFYEDLRRFPDIADITRHWASAFTAFQVINNRTSPPHTDRGTSYGALDVLTAIGDFKGGHIHTPNLPVDFAQEPGCVLALATRVIPHGVQPYEGNRISIAWFMKDDVMSWAQLPQTTWMSKEDMTTVYDY